jgi:hypothetical protein
MTKIAGCVTLLKFVQERSLSELERRLGFSSGALMEGAHILRVVELPEVEGFECYGYSTHPSNILETAGGYDEKKVRERFGDLDRWRIKELARSNWKVNGPNSLVKIRAIGKGAVDYPSGSGVPQWKLHAQVEAQLLATIGRDDVWQYHAQP